MHAVEALGQYIDLCLLQADGARVHRIGSRISYVMFLSVVNRALAVQSGARDGFAHEAEPIVRSLLNASGSFLYLATKPASELDGYAFLYWLHAERVGLDRAKELEKAGRIDKVTVDEMRAQIRQAMDDHRKAARADGITIPPKPGRRPDTWTGYTDKELLEQVGAGAWYDIYYRYLSSGVHVDATTIADDLRALARGSAEVGPRFRYAFGVLRVTVEVLHGCMLAVHRLFSVGDIRAIDQAKAAIDRELAALMQAELELMAE